MNVSLWHDLNIVVSCTIIPGERVDNIVAARENVRGSWNEHMEREPMNTSQVSQDDSLKDKIDRIASKEEELSKSLGHYVQQQTRLSELMEGIGHQLERLESSSMQNIQGKDFSTPVAQRSEEPVKGANFQVKADLDIGKFSGVEPTPHDELTFEQWVCDVWAYQRQFPDFILLPAIRKSIRGKAKSVLRSLGLEFSIDKAIAMLVREYEGVASSDVVFKDFYQMRQEKSEKVQIFSVRLREALNQLVTRFPDRIPPGDEDKILCD